MDNDLISREALKKDIQTEWLTAETKQTFYKIIDNAPTVDVISNNEGYEMYGKGYLQGYKRGKAEAIPKGEWEEPFERNGKTYHKCNHCHISSELILFGNFCPNCGADMRGGEDNR